MVASHDIIFGDKLQESVVTAIVKLCLKSLQEFVRLHTFNRSGFQQVQLDILFLRTPFREIVEDEAAVDFLLDEVWRNSVHVVLTFQICVMVIQRLEFLLCLFDFFKFFAQVIVATAERCLDPIPLEPPILDKLIQAKLTKTKEQSTIISS